MSPFAAALLLFFVTVIAFAVYVALSAIRQFGASPTGERLRRIENSPHFDRVSGTFRNERERDFRKGMPVLPMVRELFFGPQIRTPSAPLPSERPDLAKFLSFDSAAIHAVWLGHSTVLLRVGGKTILLDPTLTKRVSPVFFFGNRFQPPPLELAELPVVDYLVISHDHYDHLDADSARFFANRERSHTKVITALGVGARLESFGIAPDRIVELDWWESFEDQGFVFTATPSQHFSGRSFNDHAKTLWAGFAIRHASANLFFSGDSGYHNHFKTIGERFGPFDFAILESGQYNLWWHYVHMMPEEVVLAARDIKAKVFMPIHWGMYKLSMHDWFEPAVRVAALAAAQSLPIATPKLGEVLAVDSKHLPVVSKVSHWWESHPDFKRHEELLAQHSAQGPSTPRA